MVAPLHYLSDPEVMARERAVFVQAALELLAETDSTDLSVNNVVQRTGRHNALFYRLFGSKEGLALAVAEEAVHRTAAVVQRHMARAATPQEAVRGWVDALMGVASHRVARSALPFALDRHRLLRRFPDAEDTLMTPLRRPLAETLDTIGLPDTPTTTSAALELVMSRQATLIALDREPTPEEITAYGHLVLRLVGLPPDLHPRRDTVPPDASEYDPHEG